MGEGDVSPKVDSGTHLGVANKGSGVKCCDKSAEQHDHVDECADLHAGIIIPYVEGQPPPISPGPSQCIGMQYLTPIKTIETVQTVVSSNHVSIVSYVESPKVGMVFKTWQDVEAYYKEYAQQMGFGVTRVQGVYSKGEGRDRIATTWRCECWGKPDMRALREAKKRAKLMDVSGSGGVVDGVVCENELNRRKRRSKKCECKAMIYASINRDREWVIKKVVLEHSNHTPSPSKAKLVKEYRMKRFTSTVRKKLLHFFDKRVPVTQIHGCLAPDEFGTDNLSCTVKDLEHEVYKERRLRMVGGDSAAMMMYFQQMQSDNQNFYHAQRLDDEGRLKDVLWVDARSRAAYEEFGDVVCFDATYLTNEYDLPFVNFVGVNHHGQSILLGCALVSHEDCDTFVWIFKQWLECMNNKAPAAILTDQAAAMRRPLEEVMPNTRHRWCIWHIMRKIPEKLGKCERYTEFKSVLKAIVYESFTVAEFENRWCALVDEYELQSNDWLESLYTERHMWVPAFMKEYFWAGMKTTQRVESINSFFDGFVNRQTKLFEFPQKYAKAMEKRVQDETDADAKCSKYIRRLASGFKVEKVFQKLYTDTKFQEVQTECTRMMYCYPREENRVSDNVIQYVLEDRVWIVPEGKSEDEITDRRRFVGATFNTDTKEVLCDCRKFETHGIMCKHMMRILDLNLVFDIPERYIVSRWRKDILRKHTRVKVSYHDPNKTAEVMRYNKLIHAFEPICEEAAMVNDETVDKVLKTVENLRAFVKQCTKRKLEQTIALSYPDKGGPLVLPSSEECGTQSSVKKPCGREENTCSQPTSWLQPASESQLKDPIPKKRGRGRPKTTRHKSLAEIGFKKPSNTKKGQKKGKNAVETTPTPSIPPQINGKLAVWRNLEANMLDGPSHHLDIVPDDDLLVNNDIGWCTSLSD